MNELGIKPSSFRRDQSQDDKENLARRCHQKKLPPIWDNQTLMGSS